MGEYYLRELFKEIINISKDIETFTVEELWKWTKFDRRNECLNNSLGIHKYSGVPVEGRKELLKDQRINGNYLLFDFIGHLPEFDIKQYNNFEELIENIIGENGILNPFTTIQIPIINGRCKNILSVLKYKDETSFRNVYENKIIEKMKNEIRETCEYNKV